MSHGIESATPIPIGGGAALFIDMATETAFLGERNPDYKNNTDKKHELEFPGGKVKKDTLGNPLETVDQATAREVREEFTLDLPIVYYEHAPRACSHDSSVNKPIGVDNYLFVVKAKELLLHEMEVANSRLMNSTVENEEREILSIKRVSLRHLVETVMSKTPFVPLDCTSFDGTEQCKLPLRKFNVWLLRAAIKAELIDNYGCSLE